MTPPSDAKSDASDDGASEKPPLALSVTASAGFELLKGAAGSAEGHTRDVSDRGERPFTAERSC